jgi:hypothetical protein
VTQRPTLPPPSPTAISARSPHTPALSLPRKPFPGKTSDLGRERPGHQPLPRQAPTVAASRTHRQPLKITISARSLAAPQAIFRRNGQSSVGGNGPGRSGNRGTVHDHEQLGGEPRMITGDLGGRRIGQQGLITACFSGVRGLGRR